MHKQKGSILIEVTIALFLLTLIAVGSVSYIQKRATELQVEELAAWMLGVQKGVQRYLDSHNELITLGWVGSSMALTVADLKTDGFLPAAYPEKDKVIIRLLQEDNCHEMACHVHGVIYTRQPLLNSKGAFNAEEVAHWRQKTKGEGLIVSPQHSNWLSGGQLHLANTSTNFRQTLPAGTVALVASTSPEIVGYARLDPAGNIHTEQDLSAGKYLLLPHTERIDTSCSPIGAVTRGDDKKGLLVCEEGKWIRAAADTIEVDPAEALKDSLTVHRFFELIWGASLPFYKGGYFYQIEVDGSGYVGTCIARNPFTRGCGCKVYSDRKWLQTRNINVYQTPGHNRQKRVFLFGCLA